MRGDWAVCGCGGRVEKTGITIWHNPDGTVHECPSQERAAREAERRAARLYGGIGAKKKHRTLRVAPA